MAGADTGKRVPVEVSRECLNQGISVNSHRCRKVRGRRSRPSELGRSHNQFGVDPHRCLSASSVSAMLWTASVREKTLKAPRNALASSGLAFLGGY